MTSDIFSIERKKLYRYSIFDKYDKGVKEMMISFALKSISIDQKLDKSIGCIMGMAYGDFLGAPLEFLHVVNFSDTLHFNSDGCSVEYKMSNNTFNLELGQWTDDTSMGLCIADSLIEKKEINGSDIRKRFWNWWHCGYNNAFRLCEKERLSVGLGGNISKSLRLKRDTDPEPEYIPIPENDDSGNGSIMRLAPIPIFCQNMDFETIRLYSIKSSKTTHNGKDASEACAFMSFLIVNAIMNESILSIREFLDKYIDMYRTMTSNVNLLKLINANEIFESTEYCWNWKNPEIDILQTIKNRGSSYNSYPVNPYYFGSYCFDALAISLHSLYNTECPNSAIIKTINFLGDCDSTGSVTGQIAGAFYGFSKFNPIFKKYLNKWDDDEILLRAIILYNLSSSGDIL